MCECVCVCAFVQSTSALMVAALNADMELSRLTRAHEAVLVLVLLGGGLQPGSDCRPQQSEISCSDERSCGDIS